MEAVQSPSASMSSALKNAEPPTTIGMSGSNDRIAEIVSALTDFAIAMQVGSFRMHIQINSLKGIRRNIAFMASVNAQQPVELASVSCNIRVRWRSLVYIISVYIIGR